MDYDHAILKALYSNEILSYKDLFRETQKNCKCSDRTFDKYLKTLVKSKDVTRKQSGRQRIEYSINHKSLVMENLESLNKSIELIKQAQQKFETVLKNELNGYENFENLIKKRSHIFEKSVKLILLSMKMLRLCDLLSTSPLSSKIQQKEVTRIRKENENNIRKLYQIFQKIDSKSAQYLFSLVKRDVYSSLSLNDQVSF